jgi:hypothetical protein
MAIRLVADVSDASASKRLKTSAAFGHARGLLF